MNALANSDSPYLRQHADNPVEWVPWSDAAFAEARRRDVPVLVSIGYSTCHWCHVMAHESFEDADTAAQMNRQFVCIKVDREEHPEVDHIYMDAVQALTGHGGWPLNAFVDHQGRPFYAMTYAPRPQWRQLCDHLSRLWSDDRPRVLGAASDITSHLVEEPSPSGAIAPEIEQRWWQQLQRGYDHDHPGYGWNPQKAPKFPPNQVLQLLVGHPRQEFRAQAVEILTAMQDAGLHDRVGGGFHRYSVDAQWRLPHFEKMLYDNAQLICAYARAGAAERRADFTTTAINAGDYLLRDLRIGDAFAAAEDADDPGGEGSFYAWSPQQLSDVLGADAAARLAQEWDLTPGTAHPGRNGHAEPVVSHIPHPRGTRAMQLDREAWEPLLPRLRETRSMRPRPSRDDKLMTDQNGLALEALSWLGRLGGGQRFIDATAGLAAFLRSRHHHDGLRRLTHRPAYITDYGAALCGLSAAFSLLGDPQLIVAACAIANEAVERLRSDDGGFFTTPAGRSDLIRRSIEHNDNASPAGEAQLALGFLRLHAITGAAHWRALAEGIFSASADTVERIPSSCTTVIQAWRYAQRGPLTAVVTGPAHDPRTQALLGATRACTDPHLAIIPAATCAQQLWTCLDGRRDLEQPSVLVCVGTSCMAPASTIEAVREQLQMALAMPQ